MTTTTRAAVIIQKKPTKEMKRLLPLCKVRAKRERFQSQSTSTRTLSTRHIYFNDITSLTIFLNSRLVREIREGDANGGALSKVWDFDMKDKEAEFKDDLREASGVGKKRGRKVRL